MKFTVLLPVLTRTIVNQKWAGLLELEDIFKCACGSVSGQPSVPI